MQKLYKISFLAFLLLAPFFFCLGGKTSGEGTTLKVMTYNIRYDNPGDALNAWNNRKTKLYNVINKNNPDLLGVQEALQNQMEDLKSSLREYESFGVGRDDGKQAGEYAGIFYRKERFEFIEGNNFWLSQTPDKPGIKGWDAACVRIVTWVKLKDKSTGKIIVYFNTHFDHEGKVARQESAKLLSEKIREISGKSTVIVTGDFNATNDTDVYDIMTSKKYLKDSRVISMIPPQGPDYSFSGFDINSPHGGIIDYIFVRNIDKVLNYRIFNDNDGKFFPSDHLPVAVEILL